MSFIENIEVPPDVARVSEGLRDTGYEFTTAVADIVDNSIAAKAAVVDIRMGVGFDGDILLSVADNGLGMDKNGLINAMKYGSKRRDDLASLGKFGLGLKTASTAFCRKLVVVSRSAAGVEPLRATWDLDHMGHAGSWMLEIATPSAHEVQLLDSVANGGTGTVVIWERVDRLLADYKKPGGKPLQNAIRRLETNLYDHLALVYQRYLDPSDERARTLSIRVNGNSVRAWDPFCIVETDKPAVEKVMQLELPGGEKASFAIRAFILPRKEEFSNEENRSAARISNERQGVYVYRENRLIHGPDWLGMFKQEPHFSLLRVELSFDHKLDDAFNVDIKKSRILLNESLYDWLRDVFLTPPRREAETRYRKGAASVAKGAAVLLHTSSNAAIHQKVGALSVPKVNSVDPAKGEVDLSNKQGHSTAKIRIVSNQEPDQVHIATCESLENGVLWEASLLGGSVGVTLNTGHPYYSKAYLPNKANSVVVQALDFLLWALASAELNNIDDNNRDAFEELRIEVSRNLKKLVADLPDPSETE